MADMNLPSANWEIGKAPPGSEYGEELSNYGNDWSMLVIHCSTIE